MADFFKQLLIQLRNIWVRFNTLQKTIIASVFLICFLGITVSITISSLSGKDEGYVTLFANVDIQEAASIVAYLKETGIEFQLDNDGRTIMVPREQVHEIRMEMARQGLPEKAGRGYELFDENQLGVTDFVQNLNYKRAIEVELSRTIESLREVAQARVHITIPKKTIFMEKQEESEASVILKIQPGEGLDKKQVRGITHLVASGVQGLKARKVTVLDQHGNMLTQGFADDAVAEHTNHNMELKNNVESGMEHKILGILEGILGPNKARVKVHTSLDFDQISKTVESFDPKRKVVRSEQRDDGSRVNSPAIGDETKEGSITNYEIDRTVANIVNSPGSRKRVTVSVAVDGSYEYVEGKKAYKPRGEEELAVLENLVKNAVGFDALKNDEVYVANVQFDNSYYEEELAAMEKMASDEKWEKWGMQISIVLIALMGFIFLRVVAKNIAHAMNPPIPKYAGIDLEIEDDEIPESVKRQNEMLDRMDEMTKSSPESIAELIRSWLQESEDDKKKK